MRAYSFAVAGPGRCRTVKAVDDDLLIQLTCDVCGPVVVGVPDLRYLAGRGGRAVLYGCCPSCRLLIEHGVSDEQLEVVCALGVEELPATMWFRVEELRGRVGGGAELVRDALDEADAERLVRGLERR